MHGTILIEIGDLIFHLTSLPKDANFHMSQLESTSWLKESILKYFVKVRCRDNLRGVLEAQQMLEYPASEPDAICESLLIPGRVLEILERHTTFVGSLAEFID